MFFENVRIKIALLDYLAGQQEERRFDSRAVSR